MRTATIEVLVEDGKKLTALADFTRFKVANLIRFRGSKSQKYRLEGSKTDLAYLFAELRREMIPYHVHTHHYRYDESAYWYFSVTGEPITHTPIGEKIKWERQAQYRKYHKTLQLIKGDGLCP